MKKRINLRVEKSKEPEVSRHNQGKGIESSNSTSDKDIDLSFEKDEKISCVLTTIEKELNKFLELPEISPHRQTYLGEEKWIEKVVSISPYHAK